MASAHSDRSSAVALSGAHLNGSTYVFLTPTTGVTKASFWLDNSAATGTPRHVEGSAPLDFAGTASNGKAKPWDITTVAAGGHSITVVVQTSSGTTTVTSSFIVGTASSASPLPTVEPTASPTPNATPTAAPTAAATAAPTGTPAPTPVPSATSGGTPSLAGFVGRSGTQLTLGGKPFVFTGFNIYQANSRSNCSYTMGTGSALDTALTDIGSGSEVFRAWFFQRLNEGLTRGISIKVELIPELMYWDPALGDIHTAAEKIKSSLVNLCPAGDVLCVFLKTTL
jgi:hypothetical protein